MKKILFAAFALTLSTSYIKAQSCDVSVKKELSFYYNNTFGKLTYGIKVIVQSKGTLTSIDHYGINDTSGYQMALYKSVDNKPTELVVKTSISTESSGSEVVKLILAEPIEIDAGEYWVVNQYLGDDGGQKYFFDSNSNYFQISNSGQDLFTETFIDYSYGGGNVYLPFGLSITCEGETMSTLDIAKLPLSIYPNPVKNHEFYINGLDKKEIVQVYDLNGKLVQTISNVSNKEKVTLKKLPKGVYIVKTQNKSTKVIVD